MDNMFRTPLHWGAVLGLLVYLHEVSLKYRGVHVNVVSSAAGHSSIVRTLLARNADFMSSDSNGASPLHYAAQNNFAQTVDVFLAHPTMQDWPDNEGRTALMWAASKGADDVIHMFVKHKSNVHQTDKNGGTGLKGGDYEDDVILIECCGGCSSARSGTRRPRVDRETAAGEQGQHQRSRPAQTHAALPRLRDGSHGGRAGAHRFGRSCRRSGPGRAVAVALVRAALHTSTDLSLFCFIRRWLFQGGSWRTCVHLPRTCQVWNRAKHSG